MLKTFLKKRTTGSSIETNASGFTRYTPKGVIAGVVPVVSGRLADARETAYHAAAEALDAERVHMIINVHEGHAWYLAAASQQFASMPNAGTPLAACLPGMPNHQGDGAYQVSERGQISVAIKHMRTLEVFPDIPQGGDQATFVVNEANPVPWEPFMLSELRFVRQQTSRMVMAGLAAIALGLVIWLGATITNGILNRAVIDREQATIDETIQAVQRLSIKQPVSAQLIRLQQLSEAVIRAGGTLHRYQIHPDKPLEWVAFMPSWVTSDYLNQMGRVTVLRTSNPSTLMVFPRGMTPPEVSAAVPETMAPPRVPAGFPPVAANGGAS